MFHYFSLVSCPFLWPCVCVCRGRGFHSPHLFSIKLIHCSVKSPAPLSPAYCQVVLPATAVATPLWLSVNYFPSSVYFDSSPLHTAPVHCVSPAFAPSLGLPSPPAAEVSSCLQVILCVEERMLLKPVVTLWPFRTNKHVDQSKNRPRSFKLLLWLCIN